MTKSIIKVAAIALAVVLTACGGKQQPSKEIIVSIEPLRYLVEQITQGEVEVGVLVPAGASPETFDPTPRQMAEVEDAKLLLTTGLIDFERNLLERIGDKEKMVNLSRGIDLIEGEHSHAEAAHEHHEHHEHHAEGAHHAHHHGVDPHIWTSPRELKIMARNAYEAIAAHYPTADYEAGYEALMQRLEELDSYCQKSFEATDTKAFVIYHPALGYLARAYGLEQIAIENDGKEPSARQIGQIIDSAREKGVKVLLYQVEFPRSVVDVVAKDMGVEAMQINPLAENPIATIEEITRLISEGK
ncbi:MAG: zinc ABC transporter substrate-binding protein [Alistipes sp.]|nr:zinc ABC transporter substrate-binding protein [Alistipes sp.]MBO5400001.1 zinc ABC transporter substrate-binding protein [Alistipes sp.]